jgi:hypothetical protein
MSFCPFILSHPQQHLISIDAIASAMQSDSSREPIILYDNPSRFGRGRLGLPTFGRVLSIYTITYLSLLMCYEARLLLNYKGIEYKTEWLHGLDIEPTFKSLSAYQQQSR